MSTLRPESPPLIRSLVRLALLVSTFAALAMPVWADNVYVQYSDGRVIYVPRATSRTYIRSGGVVVQRLPSGYVSDPYGYSNGYPTYYTTTYWHKHNRHWKNEQQSQWQNNNGNHYGNGNGNGHNNNH